MSRQDQVFSADDRAGLRSPQETQPRPLTPRQIALSASLPFRNLHDEDIALSVLDYRGRNRTQHLTFGYADPRLPTTIKLAGPSPAVSSNV
jgi:hypothetical protein